MFENAQELAQRAQVIVQGGAPVEGPVDPISGVPGLEVIQAEVGGALIWFSTFRPRPLRAYLSGDGSSRRIALPATWSEGFSQIERVLYHGSANLETSTTEAGTEAKPCERRLWPRAGAATHLELVGFTPAAGTNNLAIDFTAPHVVTDEGSSAGTVFTVTTAGVVTAPGHAFAEDDPVVLGSLVGASGFDAGTTLYVLPVTGDTFSLSLTEGGAAVTPSTSGSGVIYAADAEAQNTVPLQWQPAVEYLLAASICRMLARVHGYSLSRTMDADSVDGLRKGAEWDARAAAALEEASFRAGLRGDGFRGEPLYGAARQELVRL